MKDDEVSELLTKVEDALWIGDQRAAGILLHQILLQDFTNRQAWQLLHSMRGGELTLKEFQRSFSQRYYPHLAHLLDETPSPLGGFGWEAEPIAPAFKPLPVEKPAAYPAVKPFVEPLEEDEETEEGEAALEEMEPLTPAGKPLFEVPEPLVRTSKAQVSAVLPPAEGIEAEVEAVEAEVEAEAEPVFEAEAEPAVMRFQACPGCGVALNGMEEFCTYCGIHLAALQQRMPPAGETRGAEDLPFCAACGITYPVHAHFCDRCGAALVRPGEVEAQAAEPAEILAEEPAQLPDPDTQPVPEAIQASAMAVESPAAQQATPQETEQAARQVEFPQASLPVAAVATAAAVPAGTLTITRENSFSGALFKYTIWVDGNEGERISNNKRTVLSLPAGHHTIQITKGKRASLPLAIEVKPGGNVQLYCQPPKTKTSGPRVILLSASRPMPVKTRWWAGYLLLLTILACLAAGIGTVVYYFMVIAD